MDDLRQRNLRQRRWRCSLEFNSEILGNMDEEREHDMESDASGRSIASYMTPNSELQSISSNETLTTDLYSITSSGINNDRDNNMVASESSLHTYTEIHEITSTETPYDLGLIQTTSIEHQKINMLAESLKAIRKCKMLSSSYQRVQIETEYLKLLFSHDLQENEMNFDSLPSSSRERLNGRAMISAIKIRHKVPDVSELPLDKWFVCILQQQRNVFITEPVQLTDGPLCFIREKFRFEQLGRDFQLNVFVYCLSLKKQEITDDDSESPTCSPLKSIIQSIRNNRPSSPIEISTDSSYILHATAHITPSKLHNTVFPLNHAFTTTPLHKYIRAVLETSCTLDHHRHGGLLSVGRTKVSSEGAIFYNLYWCELYGSQLAYWKDPASSDQEPLASLELKLCKSGSYVDFARPEMGARKKTLMVEAGGERWFLHSNDLGEVKEWIVKINAVLDDIWFWEGKS